MKIKQILFLFVLSIFYCTVDGNAQQTITLPAGSQKAMVSQTIGLTDLQVVYHRPAVKGRKIWGELVPYNEPWRAGADENTVISFSTNVKIEGKEIPAGKYGFHAIPTEGNWTLIFSKNHTSWGSYFYEQSEDALRVEVKPETSTVNEEYLSYAFMNPASDNTTLVLAWEKLKVSFKIEVDITQTVLANIRNEMRSLPAFTWEGPYTAANFCLERETNYEEALKWIESSIGQQANFTNLQVKSLLLAKTGKSTEAAGVMEKALSLANVMELHQYGRRLMGEKKNKEALEIFKMNAKKNPDVWPTHLGLARGYSANGDNANALKELKLALKQAPDENNKKNIESMIKKLEENKPIN